MKEIQRMSITDSVVATIKDMILSGEYKANEKLPAEMSFCQSLKVSRTSVREALRVLQALGFVEIRPGKGAFVADNQQKEESSGSMNLNMEGARFHDFMEVRMAIETLSVRLAVERCTKKQIQELKEIHEAFVEANNSHDMIKMIMLDELFHKQIVACTNNPLLMGINEQVLDAFRAYRGDSFSNDMVYQNAVEPHARILLCFETHNATLAVEEIRRHLDITSRDMELIQSKKKKG